MSKHTGHSAPGTHGGATGSGDPSRVEVEGAAPAAPDAVSGAATTGAAGEPPAAPASVDERVAALEAEALQWREFAARAQAEFDNTRRRLESRQADAIARAGERVVESLIPVLDDIDFALRHAAETGNDMHDGLLAIQTKLLGALANEGAEVLDPQGLPYDHNVANAVQMVEDPSVPDQTVTQVLQRGYRLGGRVLRPAMVVVSSGGGTR